MRSIAVVNQKGGVGKTTTTANIAHAVALMGHQVTIIDLDPQGHLAAHLGLNHGGHDGIDKLLDGEMSLENVITDIRENLKIIPAGNQLVRLERSNNNDIAIGKKLKDIVKTDCGKQDYVFIDCPPASGLLIDYALTAVDEIMVPVSGDYLSLRGLSDLVSTLNHFEEKCKKKFVKWIVMTRFHVRRRLSWEVREKLLEYFTDNVLITPIRETTVLAECPSFGKTAFEYKKGNNGDVDYKSLASNLINGECVSGNT